MDIDIDREIAVDYLVDSMEIDGPMPDSAQSTDNPTQPGPSGAAGHPEPELNISVSQAIVSETGRPVRRRQLPARYRDILPQSTFPVDATINNSEPQTGYITRVRLIVRDTIQTAANTFGLWREYQHRPSYDPDSIVDADTLADTLANLNTDNSDPYPSLLEHDPDSEPVHKNSTIESLINWQNTGSTSKSNNEVNRLVRDVLRRPGFSVEDLEGFDATRENQRLDKADARSPHLRAFQETSVMIDVPSGDETKPAHAVKIPGLYFRKLTTIIKDAFQSPLAPQYHFSPFKLYRTSPITGEDERVYSEIYNSDAFIKEHDRVQRAPVPPDDPDCKREKVIAALKFWSDSTHLANFGMAKLWPIYMLLGNLSKYTGSHPTAHACHHLAYIPSLPDWFQDIAASFHPKWKTQKKEILTHCRRELMHAVWKVLLDDDFLHAYKYGIVIKCHDGVERRVYPRIFTYSADYPEKYVLSQYWTCSTLKQGSIEFFLRQSATRVLAPALDV
jgi:hypothetical protein